MPTYVALLRGVNVGKANRVTMAEFRHLLDGLGYINVATLLNSGNAVFGAPKLVDATHAARIARALRDELKVEVPVIVKSAKELAAVVAGNPIMVGPEGHSRFLVAFTQETRALADLAAIQSLVAPPERFAIGKHAAYLFCAAGLLQSRAADALLQRAGRAVTTRNWSTTLKLNVLANGGNA